LWSGNQVADKAENPDFIEAALLIAVLVYVSVMFPDSLIKSSHKMIEIALL
jgi:hypothetical protein